ncbi:type IV secretory pathway TraG/TraD family ATPase VirD4 [Actinocorallia herbida]|uniref:Type IV secretory pathway TraG/TraD family ATPase VirD4 n=1 Tax=Actinocorallia herbida TaxID=58109 RepID=A0A3N1D3N0_9ACTN|nr:TraM recognition domain-containing protein [Actinocorallia herbida]ROO88110.1 type IV secretory pathway TraG/TraD family ATPase VirD4 [Actinocorallia herbida]
MTRTLGPRPSAVQANGAVGWMVLIVCWVPVGVSWVLWAGAWAAAFLSGGEVADFGTRFIGALITRDWAAAWPGTPTWLVILTWLLTFAPAAFVALRLFQIGRPAPDDPVAALARNPGVDGLTRETTSARAVKLRRSLKDAKASDAHIGLLLGKLMVPRGEGPALFSSWEDTITAFMAPRSGKTTALAIPYVLSAPGPVVVTSNKADLWAATADLREEIWLFDPQRIAYQPQTFWWNPLEGLSTVEEAHRLAGHFVATVDDPQKKDLWGPAAQDLLTALFLAASGSGGTLRQVARWLDEPGVPTPIELLHARGFELLASSLQGTQNGAVETRDGIYQTARTAAKCLRDEEIIAWVTPQDGLPAFRPPDFTPLSTLYLLSKSRSAASPLIAALTDAVMRAAERRAERMGGRLDPPLVVVLDEAANICRITDLPELYSHLGSRGIIPVTILQSYEQGITVWNEHGMAALWGATTRKLIGAGGDSPRLARDLATLVGQHDVPTSSLTYGDGRTSEQVSLRRQDILEPAAIRALKPGTALLLATGAKPALIRLQPWYLGEQAEAITASITRAEAAIAHGATQH